MKHLILAAAATAAIVTVASAQSPTPAQTIQMRQANYKQMATAMKGLNEELRADTPAIATVRRHVQVFATHAPRVLRWFPAGTGPEAGVRTRAKAEIWSDPDGFRRAGAGLLLASRSLSAAVRSGDIAAVRAAAPALGRACAACHDVYRAPAN